MGTPPIAAATDRLGIGTALTHGCLTVLKGDLDAKDYLCEGGCRAAKGMTMIKGDSGRERSVDRRRRRLDALKNLEARCPRRYDQARRRWSGLVSITCRA